ncbi:MAG: 1-acyl-sn-glycerol-3-phosphate acyltransferase [Treponema sp.]|jgi:1-acyl-sn-glycerol-3-phosphate acyltransferase|nr:1-acyl-sn-glycerol-3-phosphate acyltransferase [Treponema sp.]
MKKTAVFIPDTGIRYPDNPGDHMITPEKISDFTLDADYPFLDRSPQFRFRSGLIYLGIFVLVFVLNRLRFGLKIEGRDILRKHRRLLKDGAMTVSNHVLRWDFLCVLQAVRFRRLYYPAWKENLMGRDRNLIRWTGGIPVPEEIHLIRYFNRAFDELHEKKKWFHVFPEACRWDYFRPIRPFKKGMFTMAYRYNIPVIPLAFSYRKPWGPYALLNRLRKKNLPLVTLRIGEPILPNATMGRKEAVEKMRRLCHAKIVELAGIQDNPYPCDAD